MRTVKLLPAVSGFSLAFALLFTLAAAFPGLAQTNVPIPTVTILATTPDASLATGAGIFTLSRQSDTNVAVKVYYNIGGTASNGVDYATIPSTVTIPAGAYSNTVTIAPLNPNLANSQTVVLQLAPPPTVTATYKIGWPGTAVVYIEGQSPTNLPPPTVAIVEPKTGESYAAPASIFILASANETGGYVKTVQFFAGTNTLGTFTNLPPPPPGGITSPIIVPPQFFWTNVPAGNYLLTAVATGSGGTSSTSAPVTISVLTVPPPTNPPPFVAFLSPTNGQVFNPLNVGTAATDIQLVARATDTNSGLTNVEFFAGTNNLGPGYPIILDPPGINGATGLVYLFDWINPSAGGYALTATATDKAGLSTTSAPVNITIALTAQITIRTPAGGTVFYTPTNIFMSAGFNYFGSQGPTNVKFFAGTNDLGPADFGAASGFSGVATLTWTNPPSGSYALTAIASYTGFGSTTSAPVNISVLPPRSPTNRPPVARIISPPNGAEFPAPVNIPIYAYAQGSTSAVSAVEFLAGTNILGLGAPVPRPQPGPGGGHGSNPPGPLPFSTNLFALVWSNAPVGIYDLTAVATASGGTTTSAPVNITVLAPLPPPSNRPPVINIVATDPVAVEGTNSWVWLGLTNNPPTWAVWPPATPHFCTNSAPKTATFTVLRAGSTNDALTVSYALGGTASNGVDYVTLPGSVTVPAGIRQALITVVPIDDTSTNGIKTVVLTLTASTNSPLPYTVGFPSRAAALIIDSEGPWPVTAVAPGSTFHFHASGPNATWFYIESSTNLSNWSIVCTNQVVNGSIDFVDPASAGQPSQYYRAVPLTGGPAN